MSAAGLGWYEVSNWATGPDAQCRHNVGYWNGDDWWGVGPGAHSHVGGVRWWNVKHPAAYAGRLAAGESPAHARETLDAETRRVERVLLEIRLRPGCRSTPSTRPAAPPCPAWWPTGWSTCADEALVLTTRGRLLADAVVRALLP